MTEAWMSKRVGITECRDKPNDMSVVGAAFTLVAEVTEGNRNKFCVFCQRLRQLSAKSRVLRIQSGRSDLPKPGWEGTYTEKLRARSS